VSFSPTLRGTIAMPTSSRLTVLEDGCDEEKMKKIAVDYSAMGGKNKILQT
jgi:hypothetical protein